MRSKNREISIFSISALDLFASALGAFIIITIVLLPYFPNTGDSAERVANVRAELERVRAHADSLQTQLDEAMDQLGQERALNENLRNELAELQELYAETGQLRSDLSSCQRSMDTLQSDLESCESRLEQTFLIVMMRWQVEGDIDLHVTDPRGNEFSYSQDNSSGRHFPGSPASLSLDNRTGPGVEMWQHPLVTPGRYKVEYRYYGGQISSVAVTGYIFSRNDRIELPQTVLRNPGGPKQLIGYITVSDDGRVIFN